MGTPAIGQVVLVPFPFSDLSRTKMRPAIVLAESGRDDWILCQVTSNPYGDEKAIMLVDKDFQSGSLRVTSYARPGKLFTANASLMSETVGTLKRATIKKLIDGVIEIFQEGIS
ncbi:MAG: type II toxin-antitoxin system PemK/MazF family toxin [Anaerolineales bacterium]|nr:type II toxin-antitoxin system PemK/MazF family toxin [Anaerolineales bacterium]